MNPVVTCFLMWAKIGDFMSAELFGVQEKTALYPKQRCIEPCYIEGAVYIHKWLSDTQSTILHKIRFLNI